ncbi:MAG: T9SS type A sorting domain-containing protein [bacterium]
MKKFVYLIILFLTFRCFDNLNAQGFSFTNLGPVLVQYPYIADTIRNVNRRAIVRNNSSAVINFRFARIVNNIPPEWTTQMTYDLSYPPFIDTISIPADPPLSIPPNHQDTSFNIDFACTVTGLGTAIVRMFNTDNPSQYVQDTFKVQIGTVGITPLSSFIKDYNLYQNYPNPFNPVTVISYQLTVSSYTKLNVYDVLGNEVATLINKKQNAGSYSVEFEGSNFASGIYFYKLIVGNFTDVKRMMLIK